MTWRGTSPVGKSKRVATASKTEVANKEGIYIYLSAGVESIGRPILDEIHQRKIWARFGPGKTLGQAQSFCDGRVILGELLGNEDGAVLHIAERHERCGCLLSDKGAKIFDLRTEADSGAIVDEDRQGQARLLSSCWHPARHGAPVAPLIHKHILLCDGRKPVAVFRFNTNHHANRSPLGLVQLLSGDGNRKVKNCDREANPGEKPYAL
jgi:hypothetical protein